MVKGDREETDKGFFYIKSETKTGIKVEVRNDKITIVDTLYSQHGDDLRKIFVQHNPNSNPRFTKILDIKDYFTARSHILYYESFVRLLRRDYNNHILNNPKVPNQKRNNINERLENSEASLEGYQNLVNWEFENRSKHSEITRNPVQLYNSRSTVYVLLRELYSLYYKDHNIQSYFILSDEKSIRYHCFMVQEIEDRINQFLSTNSLNLQTKANGPQRTIIRQLVLSLEQMYREHREHLLDQNSIQSELLRFPSRDCPGKRLFSYK